MAISSRCRRHDGLANVFFLAIVRKGDGAIDYLTLERTDNDGVMLGGWNAEGGHLNYGEKIHARSRRIYRGGYCAPSGLKRAGVNAEASQGHLRCRRRFSGPGAV